LKKCAIINPTDDNFIGSTAHEQNNFISSISDLTELAYLDVPKNSELVTFLENMQKSIVNNQLLNKKRLNRNGLG